MKKLLILFITLIVQFQSLITNVWADDLFVDHEVQVNSLKEGIELLRQHNSDLAEKLATSFLGVDSLPNSPLKKLKAKQLIARLNKLQEIFQHNFQEVCQKYDEYLFTSHCKKSRNQLLIEGASMASIGVFIFSITGGLLNDKIKKMAIRNQVRIPPGHSRYYVFGFVLGAGISLFGIEQTSVGLSQDRLTLIELVREREYLIQAYKIALQELQ